VWESQGLQLAQAAHKAVVFPGPGMEARLACAQIVCNFASLPQAMHWFYTHCEQQTGTVGT